MTTEADRSAETTRHLAYAEAAVLLLESVMRVLVVRNVVTLDEMLSEVETAIATKQEMVKDGLHAEISTVAAGVLTTLANSLAAGAASKGGIDST